MSSNQEPLSKDLVFDVLSSPRRRYILYYLRRHGGEISLSELATQAAAWEYETDPDDLTDQQEKRVYVSLYQTHIPKLNSLDLVEYDADRGVVSLTPRAKDLDQYLSAPETTEPQWHLLYLLTAGVGAVLLLLSVFEVGFFGDVNQLALGFAIVAAFVVLALVHNYYDRFANRSDEIPEELRSRE